MNMRRLGKLNIKYLFTYTYMLSTVRKETTDKQQTNKKIWKKKEEKKYEGKKQKMHTPCICPRYITK